MVLIIQIFLVLFFVLTFLPATRLPHWFFRTPDFLRPQLITAKIITLLLYFVYAVEFGIMFYCFLIPILIAIIYQAVQILPFSRIYFKRKQGFTSDGMVSLLAANVLQTNMNYRKLIDLITSYDPDLVVTMETDSEWEDHLSEIESIYTDTVKVPLSNLYGMHVYSKSKLSSVSVEYLVESNVPSIHFELILPDKSIYFACVHPAPPSPTENQTSKERDAELMVVGKMIRKKQISAVVCGDMNDVVWSRTTRLFRKMTGMLDPRIGRGFFSTYHSRYWFFRFPLDHLFHTKDLFVGKMERSKYFGSDHFAMYYEIHYQNKKAIPDNPNLDKEETDKIASLIDRTEN